jgi:hypothetical protein
MNDLEARVEAAIVKNGITDADEKPVEQPKVDPVDEPKKDDTKDDKKPDEKVDDKPKYDKDGKRIEEDDATKPEPKKEDKKDDDAGFTADDAVEVEEKPTEQPTPTDAAGIQLSTAEQKYVVDNIGDPLIIRGIRGTGDNAKEVELKVFDPTQIPKDFQFASQADLLAAQQGFSRLESKAETLLGAFRNQQSQAQNQDFEKRENEGIRADVAELQADGDFPKFKIKPGEKGFDDDPAAQEMAKVLDIMTKTNEQYMKEYQQGRPYKHIGFKEAYDTYQKVTKKDDKVVEQKQEDDERKQIANKVGTNRGMSSSNLVRPTVKPGTTTRDLLDRIDNGEF